MVATLSISIGVVTLLGLYQLLKPRIPQYAIQVQSMYPTLLDLNDSTTLAYTLNAHVQMHNDNYIAIHIHALTFDMFYPNWNHRLQHVGQVTDKRQQQQQQQQHNAGTSSSSSSSSSRDPIWALEPQSGFEIDDAVILIPHGSFNVMSSLLWDTVTSWGGNLQVPLVGVIHIAANGFVPLTLSMVCNNLLDTWKLTVVGLQCDLDNLTPGWKDMTEESKRLREKLAGSEWKPTQQQHQQQQQQQPLHVPLEEHNVCLSLKENDGYIHVVESRIEWEDVLPSLFLEKVFASPSAKAC